MVTIGYAEMSVLNQLTLSNNQEEGRNHIKENVYNYKVRRKG
jgi:hypothetical protein